MESISTIQKSNKLNIVRRGGDIGAGGAYHEYQILVLGRDGYTINLNFQHGGRGLDGSSTGIVNEDLLEICRDRLKSFQTGEYACRENAIALTHIEEALMWLDKRAQDRAELKILGINKK